MNIYVMNNLDENTVNQISRMVGMTYSLADEPKIMREIIVSDYDMKLTSQYADAVCIENHMNIHFLDKQLGKDDYSIEKLQQIKHKMHNPTSLGNIAYLALHSPSPYNGIALEIYQQVVRVVKGQPIDFDLDQEGWLQYLIREWPMTTVSVGLLLTMLIIQYLIKKH